MKPTLRDIVHCICSLSFETMIYPLLLRLNYEKGINVCPLMESLDRGLNPVNAFNKGGRGTSKNTTCRCSVFGVGRSAVRTM